MNKTFKQISEDLLSCDLPEDINNLKKVSEQCLVNGCRIGWWYQEDEEYAKQYYCNDEQLKNDPPHQGIIVIAPDREYRHFLDIEDGIIVIDTYPCEKSYPITQWITLTRLLNNPDLVSIVCIKEKI